MVQQPSDAGPVLLFSADMIPPRQSHCHQMNRVEWYYPLCSSYPAHIPAASNDAPDLPVPTPSLSQSPSRPADAQTTRD